MTKTGDAFHGQDHAMPWLETCLMLHKQEFSI